MGVHSSHRKEQLRHTQTLRIYLRPSQGAQHAELPTYPEPSHRLPLAGGTSPGNNKIYGGHFYPRTPFFLRVGGGVRGGDTIFYGCQRAGVEKHLWGWCLKTPGVKDRKLVKLLDRGAVLCACCACPRTLDATLDATLLQKVSVRRNGKSGSTGICWMYRCPPQECRTF